MRCQNISFLLSQSDIDKNVPRATPPSNPPLGDGLTNARGSLANRVILVLSPKIDPPDTFEVGSIV